MKRLLQTLAISVVALTPFALSNNAFAVSTCAIGYTGPNSNNLCESTTTFACTVDNTNVVDVTNTNVQIAVSGNGSTSGNGTGGNTATGSSTNSNGVTFTATVTNPTLENKTCTVVATVPATITPTPVVVTQTVPTGGAGGAGGVAALPNTSGDPFVLSIIGLVTAFGAVAVLSRLAVIAVNYKKS